MPTQTYLSAKEYQQCLDDYNNQFHLTTMELMHPLDDFLDAALSKKQKTTYGLLCLCLQRKKDEYFNCS